MTTAAKPHTAILKESFLESVVSDTITFARTAALIHFADGKSLVWQCITVAIFFFFATAKLGMLGKIHRFYSKRELLEWAQSLPEDKG